MKVSNFVFGLLAACFLVVAAVSDAADLVGIPDEDEVARVVDISKGEGNEPVKIVTRENVVYVYPCGQVTKEVAEVLNENEEYGTFSGVTTGHMLRMTDEGYLVYGAEP